MRTQASGSLGGLLILLVAGGLPAAAEAPFSLAAPAKGSPAEWVLSLDDSCSKADLEAAGQRAQLKQLGDADLESLVKDPRASSGRGFGYERCLREVINRGGQHWETVLTDLLKARGQGELALLTALRRVQKKGDPLTIRVFCGVEREYTLGLPMVFLVSLENVDWEQRPVNITWGGDYRSGRLARWRFEVTDANGVILPQKELWGMGGGLFDRRDLPVGGCFTAKLDLSSYVEIEKPGDYTVRILYHDIIAIADVGTPATLDGLILCRSVPIRVKVLPVVVKQSENNRRQIADWIAGLPDQGTVRILSGAYVEASHGFISPESPAGKILATGWPAVPQLIQAANSDKTPPTRRAWALGLLFGITGRNNPAKDDGVISFEDKGVLGPYEFQHSGWAIRAADHSMGYRLGSTTPYLSDQIDEKKQLEFARLWLPWIEKGCIKVETVPEAKAASN